MKPLLMVWSLALSSIFFASGCGQSGPQLGAVTGTVTLDGKSVPGALVTFISKEADGSSSYGKTDSNGKYKLEFSTERFGAMLGNHDVVITTKRMSADEAPDTGTAEKTEFVAIPKHYARGALTAEVKSGSNVCDFALSTKKPN